MNDVISTSDDLRTIFIHISMYYSGLQKKKKKKKKKLNE